ncbi:uncharacterized protein LOC133778220 [Humulus lupulus]|uniref:uncharacterized protein LOC133778220 n=1 Tax=Humulus lupulus TaxID=3486 RepID=UPI002B407D08|nr:uncharacterized protein LOC133778220 [Humulus lupulus]
MDAVDEICGSLKQMWRGSLQRWLAAHDEAVAREGARCNGGSQRRWLAVTVVRRGARCNGGSQRRWLASGSSFSSGGCRQVFIFRKVVLVAGKVLGSLENVY